MKIKIDSEKIEKAIEKFESKVDFELVPVISLRSTSTLHVKWVVSVILILLSYCGVEAYYLSAWQDWDAQKMLEVVSLVSLLALVLAHFMAKIEALERILTPKGLRDRQVHMTAEQVFLKKRLFETKANQGLLLFISLMERRIVILPDFRSQFAGSAKLTEEVLKILQVSFKSGSYEEGLLKAIEHLQNDLAPQFPKKSEVAVENQIPNKLIWWE